MQGQGAGDSELAGVLIVLKYGGHAMTGGADPVLDEVAQRIAAGDRIVLVHGGGPQIDGALRLRGIGERRVAGLRVTDAATLEVVEAVLCGTVNKALVRALAARGLAAAGTSGQDGGLLRATRATGPGGEDLGAVGDDLTVDPGLLRALLDGGFLPVVAPLAVDAATGEALNVNADTAAGAIAGALGAGLYANVTNVARVLRDLADPGSEIAVLSRADALRGLADGSFAGGMEPKLRSALLALGAGAARAVVCGGGSPIAAALSGAATEIVADPA